MADFRERAIDALKQQADEMAHWAERYAEQRKGILTAVNIVSDVPSAQPDYDLSDYSDKLWKAAYERGKAEAEPRWIPVEDKGRRPRDGQRVLITDEDGGLEFAYYIDFSSIDESAEWWAHDYQCYPIAWSEELPKPYERRENEQQP